MQTKKDKRIAAELRQKLHDRLSTDEKITKCYNRRGLSVKELKKLRPID